NWLILVPLVIETIKNNGAEITQILGYCRDFISKFIQDYHQLKEEDHLFSVLDKKLEILNNMYDEHEEIRFYARILLTAIGDNDNTAIKESLNTYQVVLSEHIKKEEEILYPWIERNLSDLQLNELSSEFLGFDTIHPNISQFYRDIISELEHRVNMLLEK
ncbi:MAG: hemerythrin domain-containing protein, partial [Candidatus Hermodarchaeota archaeon]